MPRSALPFLCCALMVAGGCDNHPTDTPNETPLPVELVAPLRVATQDGQGRLLPSLQAYESDPLPELEAALEQLDDALAARLASRIETAAARVATALSSTDRGNGASAPDRAALGLVLAAIEQRLADAVPAN